MKKFFTKHVTGSARSDATRKSSTPPAATSLKSEAAREAETVATDGAYSSIDFNEERNGAGTTRDRADGSSMTSDTTNSTATGAAGARRIANPAQRYGSCYVNGHLGVCDVCGMVKLACSCQRCYGCNRFLMTFKNRRHCRRCWRAHCTKCTEKRRIHDFYNGQSARTCVRCAVPHALLFVSQLRYNAYETVGAADKREASKTPGKPIQRADPEDSVNAPPAVEPHAFRWGLYALLCELEAPRRCINPSCATPLSYADTCRKCRTPTVTTAPHHLRHVVVPEASSSQAKAKHDSDNSISATAAEAVEDAVRAEYDTVAAHRNATDEDELFAAALPAEGEGYLFASTIGDTWAARKVLLALVAAGIACESSAMPNVSLAMTDLPLYARLLRPVQTSELFTVFSAPGHVRIIAFNSGASRRPSVHQVLSTSMVYRELWTSAALKRKIVIGRIVRHAEEAKTEGLTTSVTSWGVRAGLMDYMADDNITRRVYELVLRLMRGGVDVVLCGHGIGGAVASWLCTRLLLEHTPEARDRLLCVTFGAPLVASRSLTKVLADNKLLGNYQHFVHASDMVPRLSYMDSLLTSGNTTGSVSIIGHNGSTATASQVRECVVLWTASHEEPRAAHTTANDKDGEGFSVLGFARKMRDRPTSTTPDDKKKSNASRRSKSPAEAAIRVNANSDGDVFRASREPFDNNVVRDMGRDEGGSSADESDGGDAEASEDGEIQFTVEGESGAAAATAAKRTRKAGGKGRSADVAAGDSHADFDFERFSTSHHRFRQSLDPFGSYHFLWHPRGKYMCTDDPATAIALLTDRTNMRIQLKDHLLSSYNRGLTEYMHSASAE